MIDPNFTRAEDRPLDKKLQNLIDFYYFMNDWNYTNLDEFNKNFYEMDTFIEDIYNKSIINKNDQMDYKDFLLCAHFIDFREAVWIGNYIVRTNYEGVSEQLHDEERMQTITNELGRIYSSLDLWQEIIQFDMEFFFI